MNPLQRLRNALKAMRDRGALQPGYTRPSTSNPNEDLFPNTTGLFDLISKPDTELTPDLFSRMLWSAWEVGAYDPHGQTMERFLVDLDAGPEHCENLAEFFKLSWYPVVEDLITQDPSSPDHFLRKSQGEWVNATSMLLAQVMMSSVAWKMRLLNLLNHPHSRNCILHSLGWAMETTEQWSKEREEDMPPAFTNEEFERWILPLMAEDLSEDDVREITYLSKNVNADLQARVFADLRAQKVREEDARKRAELRAAAARRGFTLDDNNLSP